MADDKKLEDIIVALDQFSSKFDQAVADVDKRRAIHNTVDKLRNIKIGSVGDTLSALFKYYGALMDAKSVLDEMLDVLEFDMFKKDLIMSETHIKKLDVELKEIVRVILTIDYSVPPEWVNFDDDDPKRLSEVCALYDKHRNTMNLFIKFLENKVTPDIDVKLEVIKQDIFGTPKKGPEELSRASVPLNFIQNYGLQRSRPTTLSAIFEVKNATEAALPSLSKKHGHILLIKCKSNIRYDTWQMEELSEGKAGLTAESVELMNTIKRIKSTVKDSATLYCGKTSIDVFKLRKVSGFITDQVVDLASKIQYVIETADEETYYDCMFDLPRLVHLLSGPNPLIQIFNNEAEAAIMAHWSGPKEITWTSTHTPIAHLRQRIKERCMLYWKKHGVDTDVFQDIFGDVMFEAFNEYIGGGSGGIVKQEALVSYVSDINIKGRRFIREFNNVYNKFDPTDKTAVQRQNETEFMVGFALDMSINEKDNIFNTVDEKKALFNMFL